MEANAMSNLFEKITKGSILLWNVNDESELSHFYFTAERIQPNSFFVLKYSTKCSGSFYLEDNDFTDLGRLIQSYLHAWHVFDEVKRWSEKVEKHKEEIQASGIQDTVIEDFDVANLRAMTEGYGTQAIDHALANLRDWHDKHYWKGQTSQSSADEPAEQAATA